nr:MAG TPA: hypothetical protein [Caudoviricetes sp.]
MYITDIFTVVCSFVFVAYVYIRTRLNAPYNSNKSIVYSHLVVRIDNACVMCSI